MKIFKNRLLGIIAGVALFAAVFYTVLGIMGQTSVFHNALGMFVTMSPISSIQINTSTSMNTELESRATEFL